MLSYDEKLNELFLLYPGLQLNEKCSSTNIKGIIKIQQSFYHLNLVCPHFPQLKDMDLGLQQLHEIKRFTATDPKILPNWNTFDLMVNLPQLLVESTEHENLEYSRVSQPPTTTTENIYAEIVALYAPNDYQVQINANFSRIRFHKFINFEQHYLELSLPGLQVCTHSLPDCVAWEELLQKCDTLKALIQQFQKYLEQLQPFYDNFTDIDELCYVVQPTKATTKHNWRLFLLRDRVFLKLVLTDPFAPVAGMSLNIIGPTYEVKQLRRTFSEGLSEWDTELDIHKNLLRIFDLCFFPMPPNHENVDGNLTESAISAQYCNICYCYQLELGEIPIVSCDNMQCSLIFHAVCLKEWFNTLSDGSTFLDVAFGNCPFCKAKLSPSFAELLEFQINDT